MGQVILPSGKTAQVPDGLTEEEVRILLVQNLPAGSDKDILSGYSGSTDDPNKEPSWLANAWEGVKDDYGQIVGGTGGSLGGAAAGAAYGTIGGPVGVVLGALAGGALGGLVGGATGEAAQDLLESGEVNWQDVGAAAKEEAVWGAIPGIGGIMYKPLLRLGRSALGTGARIAGSLPFGTGAEIVGKWGEATAKAYSEVPPEAKQEILKKVLNQYSNPTLRKQFKEFLEGVGHDAATGAGKKVKPAQFGITFPGEKKILGEAVKGQTAPASLKQLEMFLIDHGRQQIALIKKGALDPTRYATKLSKEQRASLKGGKVPQGKGKKPLYPIITEANIDALKKDLYTKIYQEMVNQNLASAKYLVPFIRGVYEAADANDVINLNKGGKVGDALGNKISILRKEGMPQKQAVAVAYSMKRRGEL